ncbi:MAG: PfkB family carbohydrate kinase [Bullifex sp.]|nr:PfkB family carbohydrate kinase [Bullifex sp.]
MKRFDVIALGELLIDFTENGLSDQGNFLMEANPGGAPCNVLAMLQQLGRKTAFIGKVGDDFLGHHLSSVIEKAGICTENLMFDRNIHTTLAFVHTFPDGDRDFSFYRNPGADMSLTPEEVRNDLIADSRLFHFGTLSMTHESVRKATMKALRCAKESGCIISFDPNIREPLWESLDEARAQVACGMEFCDVLKISDNEIRWFTGKEDYDEGIRVLQDSFHIPLILLSMGKEGSRAYCKDMRVTVKPYLQKNTIETTGAGDTFCACCLNTVLEKGIESLTSRDLEEMLSFANAAASLITTRKGSLRVMPTKEEVLALQSNY